MIVDLALRFNSTVRESEVLSILRSAAKSGGFGDLTVSSITATTPTSSSGSKYVIVYFDFVLSGPVSSQKKTIKIQNF